MDVKESGQHVSLSRTDKLLLGLTLAALGGFGWRFYDGVTSKLDAVVVQQAVANQRLSDLTSQMTDLPTIKLEQAKQRVELDQVKSDVKELKQTKGLK